MDKTTTDTSHGSQSYKGNMFDYNYFNGHTRNTRYKLIGYPTEWKHRKKEKYSGNSRGSHQSVIISLMEDLVKIENSLLVNPVIISQLVVLLEAS